MKFLLSSLILLGISNLNAQEIVSVTYEGYVKTKPNLERFKNNPQKLAEMEKAFDDASKIPSIHILTFDQDEASFLLEERIENSQETEMGKVKFTACNDIFTHYGENYVLGIYDLHPKSYAIKSSLKTIDWKITNEKKELMGYEVRKATAVYDSITTVEVWYAPKLAYKKGPSQYWGLPGLILEANEKVEYSKENTTHVHFVAVSIEPNPKSAKIDRFEKLEKITQEEYDAKLEEIQKKWQEMHNDGVDKD